MNLNKLYQAPLHKAVFNSSVSVPHEAATAPLHWLYLLIIGLLLLCAGEGVQAQSNYPIQIQVQPASGGPLCLSMAPGLAGKGITCNANDSTQVFNANTVACPSGITGQTCYTFENLASGQCLSGPVNSLITLGSCSGGANTGYPIVVNSPHYGKLYVYSNAVLAKQSQQCVAFTASKVYLDYCDTAHYPVALFTELAVSGSQPAPAVSISVNPTTVTVGSSYALTWSSTNATSCTASGGWSGAQAVSGTISKTASVVGQLTYSLSCTGVGGTASSSATETVSTQQGGSKAHLGASTADHNVSIATAYNTWLAPKNTIVPGKVDYNETFLDNKCFDASEQTSPQCSPMDSLWGISQWAGYPVNLDVTMHLWATVGVGGQPGTLALVASGAEDYAFKKAAAGIHAAYPNAIVRMDNECNGGWFGCTPNGKAGMTVQDFINATCHVYKLLKPLYPTLTFTFNPALLANGSAVDWHTMYPGDSCLDAMDYDVYYNEPFAIPDVTSNPVGTATEQQRWNWTWSGAQYPLQDAIQFAQAHNKPIIFSEWGKDIDPASTDTTDAQYDWVTNMCAVIKQYNITALWWENTGASNFESALGPEYSADGKTLEYPKMAAAYKASCGQLP